MDEKEQADRLAAAEALFMISNRGEKPQLPVKLRPTRRGKKQKVVDYEDITASKKRTEDPRPISPRSKSRSKSSDGANPTNDRGRGRRGGSNTRGRGRGRGKKQNNTGRNHKSRNDDSESDDNNVPPLTIDTETSHRGPSPELVDQVVTKPTRGGRGKKRGGKSKTKSQPRGSRQQEQENDVSGAISTSDHAPAVGLSGATLSKSGPSRGDGPHGSTVFVQTGSDGNLPSLGLVSGFNKVSLANKSHAGAETSALPSINLTSLTEGNLPSVNLPSLPSEYPFLQLSSQPTPNLSSLGDVTVSQSIEVDVQPDREKSEKFLPLKKRKLHKAEESANTPTTVVTDSPVDGLSVSDSEERYEAVSPERARSPFTVQAPPIITMQTLMEIKTALQADDDGDLPLHIAVVHENMRMVAKLISLMRIAGKNVDKFNKQQQTPLHLAIKLDFTEAVVLLLKSGADVNAVDCSGSSAIHMAVQGRSTPILRLLLEQCRHVQLNNRNIEGLTPLHTAVDNGDLEQADLLLRHGADIDVTDGKSGRTPLFRAAESNHKPMVEMLLKRGANVDVQSYAGVTVSMAAQGRNLHGVLKLLGSVQDKFSMDGGPGKSPSTNPPPPLLFVGLSAAGKPSPLPSGLTGYAQAVSPPLSMNSSLPLSTASTSATHSAMDGVKKESEPLTYLVRPQSKVGRVDMTSGGVMLERADAGSVTKVFHNIFMLTDDKKGRVQMESMSAPSSPEAKMEVDGETKPWKKERPRGAGLFSLPETIDIRVEDLETTKESSGSQKKISTLDGALAKPPATVIRRVAVGSPQLPGSPGREASAHGMSGNFVGRLSSDGVIHLVPSSSVSMVPSSSAVPSSPRSTISKLAMRPLPSTSINSFSLKNQGQTSSSTPILLPVLSTALPSSKSSSPHLPSSPSSSSSPKSGSGAQPPAGDTSTSASLSSIQAKLYETLLRRSQSVPGSSPTPQESGAASPSSASGSVMSKLLLSPVRSQPQSSASSPPGAVSYRVVSGGSASGPLLESISARRGTPASVPLIRVPTLSHTLKSTGSSPTSSPPSTPLNLSKPSSIRRRQDSTELSDVAPTQGGSSNEHSGQVGDKPARKVISIGMRRLSGGDKPGPSSLSSAAVSAGAGGFQSQYEMYLLPQKQKSEGAAPHSFPGKKAGATPSKSPVSSLAHSPQRPSIVLDPEVVANIEKGELNLSNFPHVSKCVRDLLSRQNQLLQKSSSLSSTSSGVSTPAGSSLVTPHQPPGRIIIPPAPPGQNSIVGLSGAILSVVPDTKVSSKVSSGRTPDTASQADERRERHSHNKKSTGSTSSLKEQPVRKGRGSRGGNKGQSGSQTADASNSNVQSTAGSIVTASGQQIPNLSKINSETDEKLKKFLVAKRQEGLQSEKSKGTLSTVKKDKEDEVGAQSTDDSSLKTVGIFSGNVQKVKIDKPRVSTAPVTSSPSQSVPVCSGPTPLLSPVIASSSPSFPSAVQVVISSLPEVTVSPGTPKSVLEDSSSSTAPVAVLAPTSKSVLAATAAVKTPVIVTDVFHSTNSAAITTNSDSPIEVDEDDDGEEPMEIVIPNSPSSNEAGERSSETTAPSASLMNPKVKIVVQSPTPPLPSESSEPADDVGNRKASRQTQQQNKQGSSKAKGTS